VALLKKLETTFSASRRSGILYSKNNQNITLSKVVNNFMMLYIGVAVSGSAVYLFRLSIPIYSNSLFHFLVLNMFFNLKI
jgi:hypothetical protein